MEEKEVEEVTEKSENETFRPEKTRVTREQPLTPSVINQGVEEPKDNSNDGYIIFSREGVNSIDVQSSMGDRKGEAANFKKKEGFLDNGYKQDSDGFLILDGPGPNEQKKKEKFVVGPSFIKEGEETGPTLIPSFGPPTTTASDHQPTRTPPTTSPRRRSLPPPSLTTTTFSSSHLLSPPSLTATIGHRLFLRSPSPRTFVLSQIDSSIAGFFYTPSKRLRSSGLLQTLGFIEMIHGDVGMLMEST
ncbi:hypothetical protein L6452_25108 [Arctium lappa]|uniref:Uncharacterized protein n=1 Tax=Arctium lappa TaxID=4217 RepID=A0ACB9AAU9_ARCLA|nr:hypothetical protein L6452_25108 [Arctium lappa]